MVGLAACRDDGTAAVRSWRSSRRARRRLEAVVLVHLHADLAEAETGEDGLRRDVVRSGRCAEPRHTVLPVRPVEQRAYDLGRDALASMLRLDAIADLHAPVLVGRSMKPDRADDRGGPPASSSTIARPSHGWIVGSAVRSAMRYSRKCSRSSGMSAGTVAPIVVAAPSVSPSRERAHEPERHRDELEARRPDRRDRGHARIFPPAGRP